MVGYYDNDVVLMTLGEVIDDSKDIFIEVARYGHGTITAVRISPTPPINVGASVTISVDMINDGDAAAMFELRWSSKQILGGYERVLSVSPRGTYTFNFSFTMPSTDVSIHIDLIRAT